MAAVVWPMLMILTAITAINGRRIWPNPDATAVERRM
ncbi:hypothetical protein AMIS_27950 [Actinoplanes missouriensis 431]|uniref:Uncharacterized protein n=1 Tax=Actinoplanes missouriensis (strain ATCC 14538 / DSM 43046 / CBS 188.64 / JCM 3121 / NBRC 102363 / NCIMB 12654 / NRRL B-3342 / UNCC 431) TaxID=512565 RepID=I0H4S8_ACTM4|nr:hypothetical protein AMIS_27950 [Actinoplanes missouriensis 431]